MEATATRLLRFLRKSAQFVIPIYQRTYSWTETECRQLWDDIIRVGESEKVNAHFIGSIVYIEKGQYHISTQSPLLVIDGQQRLATIALLINALVDALRQLDESRQEPMEGFSPRKLQNYYLLNPEESDEQRFKLILSQTDKSTLISILEGREAPKEISLNIAANYKLFQSWIAARQGDLVPVCNGLGKLMVVDIALDRTQDNPQLIFESMNSTGRELTQADLIRNFILMGLEPDLQTRLYEEYWRRMEVDFGQEAYGALFDGFMRYYLTVKTGNLPNVHEVYDAFKRYSRGPEVVESGVEAMVADLRSFAHYFCAMALGAEKDPELKTAFHDLRELKADVTYPLLLELYRDYSSNVLPRADFVTAVRHLEAYVFRRAVCSIPTNSMDKTFAGFGKSLRKDRYLESIEATLLLLPSYRRMPSDEEFYRDLQTHDLYNFSRRSYWLRRLENYKRKERVTVEEFTIEHILPQNPNLPAAWREALGENWRQVQQTWLHTLGNLTLTGYNSEYSDQPFHEKRDMKGGFRDSPIILNAGLGQLEKWNEQTITERAARLADTALKAWPVPKLPEGILDKYREPEPPPPPPGEGNPLPLIPTLDLFEALRKEIRALDPKVVEEFLKQSVVYKMEGIFVRVNPRKHRLGLVLSIPVADINDPKGLCKDTSGKKWGNGKVVVKSWSLEDLPYVVGLVRQTLEHWLSNGDSDE